MLVAAQNGHADAVEMLYRLGARPDVPYRVSCGRAARE
jgi:hypothetical protein